MHHTGFELCQVLFTYGKLKRLAFADMKEIFQACKNTTPCSGKAKSSEEKSSYPNCVLSGIRIQ
jgi:hypothetical protein